MPVSASARRHSTVRLCARGGRGIAACPIAWRRWRPGHPHARTATTTVRHGRRPVGHDPTPPHHDRGSHSVEALLVFSLLVTVILGTVQVAFWFTARNAARHAATSAVLAATLEDGTEETARTEAERSLERTGEAVLFDHSVQATRTATEVEVTITGEALSLVPFFPVHVTATSTGAVERWTNP